MNDLDGVLGQAWALLAEGAADPGSAWRVMTLANVTASGGPGVRSVVLRGVDQPGRVAVMHSDVRSPKVAALGGDPRAALLGWDAGRRVQIRLDGVVELAGVAETDAAWVALPEASRVTYAGALAPGTPMGAPECAPGVPDRAVFCVLRLRVAALEYVSLAQRAHRRARFDWTGGAVAATWLVP
jgi:hypothetical protein